MVGVERWKKDTNKRAPGARSACVTLHAMVTTQTMQTCCTQPQDCELRCRRQHQGPWLTSLRCRRVTSTTTVASFSSLTADLLRFMPARSLSDLLPRLALDRGRATCRTHANNVQG